MKDKTVAILESRMRDHIASLVRKYGGTPLNSQRTGSRRTEWGMTWDSNLDPQSPAYQIAADNSRYTRVLAGPGTVQLGLPCRCSRWLCS